MNLKDCGLGANIPKRRLQGPRVPKWLMGPPTRRAPKRKGTTASVSSTSSSSQIHWMKRDSGVLNNSTLLRSCSSTLSHTSTEPDTKILLALCEGRGEARCEVGIAVINVSSPSLILCQISDTHSYVNTLTKINVLNPDEILIPSTFVQALKPNRLITMVKDKFSDIKITTVARRTFNKDAGLQYVKDLCAPAWNSVLFTLQHRYYALAACAALFTFTETMLFVFYAKDSIKVEYQESEGSAIIDITTADKLELVSSARPSVKIKNSNLLAILNYCITRIGLRTLRASILQPSCSVPDIEARLDCVTELMKNPVVLAAIQTGLEQLRNIDKLLTLATVLPDQAEKCSERQLDYILLLNSLLELISPLRETFKDFKQSFFLEFQETLNNPLFDEIKKIIRTMIHTDACPGKGQNKMLQRCFCIKPGINGLLDLIRKIYSERLDDLRLYVQRLGEEYNLALSLNNNNKKGYHIVLSFTALQKRTFKVADLSPIFIQVERLSSTVTMKTRDLINLSQRIEDIMMEILKMSNLMIYKILIEIRKHVGLFYKLCEEVAKLDLLQSLAKASCATHYVRPKFDNYLEIVHGRHPLLDFILPKEPSSNSVNASNEYNMHIITGPNGSGKTIFIRQIVLTQIMAQVGCYVPAQSATFRVADRILARINFGDNMEFGASAFMLEMKDIQYFLNVMTPNTLMIVDELCRSTSVEEGTAMAMAICEHIIKLPAFAFFTTHYKFLAKLGDMYLSVKNWQMEAIEEVKNDRKILHYTYNVIPGVLALENYGFFIAQAAWPKEPMKYATDLLNTLLAEPKVSFPSVQTIDPKDRLKYDLECELKFLKARKKLTRAVLQEKITQYEKSLAKLGQHVTVAINLQSSSSYGKTNSSESTSTRDNSNQEMLRYESTNSGRSSCLILAKSNLQNTDRNMTETNTTHNNSSSSDVVFSNLELPRHNITNTNNWRNTSSSSDGNNLNVHLSLQNFTEQDHVGSTSCSTNTFKCNLQLPHRNQIARNNFHSNSGDNWNLQLPLHSITDERYNSRSNSSSRDRINSNLLFSDPNNTRSNNSHSYSCSTNVVNSNLKLSCHNLPDRNNPYSNSCSRDGNNFNFQVPRQNILTRRNSQGNSCSNNSDLQLLHKNITERNNSHEAKTDFQQGIHHLRNRPNFNEQIAETDFQATTSNRIQHPEFVDLSQLSDLPSDVTFVTERNEYAPVRIRRPKQCLDSTTSFQPFSSNNIDDITLSLTPVSRIFEESFSSAGDPPQKMFQHFGKVTCFGAPYETPHHSSENNQMTANLDKSLVLQNSFGQAPYSHTDSLVFQTPNYITVDHNTSMASLLSVNELQFSLPLQIDAARTSTPLNIQRQIHSQPVMFKRSTHVVPHYVSDQTFSKSSKITPREAENKTTTSSKTSSESIAWLAKKQSSHLTEEEVRSITEDVLSCQEEFFSDSQEFVSFCTNNETLLNATSYANCISYSESSTVDNIGKDTCKENSARVDVKSKDDVEWLPEDYESFNEPFEVVSGSQVEENVNTVTNGRKIVETCSNSPSISYSPCETLTTNSPEEIVQKKPSLLTEDLESFYQSLDDTSNDRAYLGVFSEKNTIDDVDVATVSPVNQKLTSKHGPNSPDTNVVGHSEIINPNLLQLKVVVNDFTKSKRNSQDYVESSVQSRNDEHINDFPLKKSRKSIFNENGVETLTSDLKCNEKLPDNLQSQKTQNIAENSKKHLTSKRSSQPGMNKEVQIESVQNDLKLNSSTAYDQVKLSIEEKRYDSYIDYAPYDFKAFLASKQNDTIENVCPPKKRSCHFKTKPLVRELVPSEDNVLVSISTPNKFTNKAREEFDLRSSNVQSIDFDISKLVNQKQSKPSQAKHFEDDSDDWECNFESFLAQKSKGIAKLKCSDIACKALENVNLFKPQDVHDDQAVNNKETCGNSECLNDDIKSKNEKRLNNLNGNIEKFAKKSCKTNNRQNFDDDIDESQYDFQSFLASKQLKSNENMPDNSKPVNGTEADTAHNTLKLNTLEAASSIEEQYFDAIGNSQISSVTASGNLTSKKDIPFEGNDLMETRTDAFINICSQETVNVSLYLTRKKALTDSDRLDSTESDKIAEKIKFSGPTKMLGIRKKELKPCGKNLNVNQNFEHRKTKMATETNRLPKMKKLVFKFVPPKPLTRREIKEEYMKQDQHYLESDDPSSYLQNMVNRPTVQQLQQMEHVALLRKTDAGLVYIPPTPKTPKRKFFTPLKYGNMKDVDAFLMSDKNSDKLEKKLQLEPTPKMSFTSSGISDYYLGESSKHITSATATKTTPSMLSSNEGGDGSHFVNPRPSFNTKIHHGSCVSQSSSVKILEQQQAASFRAQNNSSCASDTLEKSHLVANQNRSGLFSQSIFSQEAGSTLDELEKPIYSSEESTNCEIRSSKTGVFCTPDGVIKRDKKGMTDLIAKYQTME